MSSHTINLTLVTSGETPAEGMGIWNTNDQTIETAYNSHVTNLTAHQPDPTSGPMVFEDFSQTLSNKIIRDLDGNNIQLTTSGIRGDIINIQTLQQPAPGGADAVVDWGLGYSSASGSNDIISISGLNGIEVRRAGGTLQMDIQHPENVVLNSGTQTLNVNTPYNSSDGQTLKVGGKGTFTDQLTVSSGGLNISGLLAQTDSTDSSSISTGSIKTAGGLGVVKKLYIGDNIIQTAEKEISDGSGNKIELNTSSDLKISSNVDILLAPSGNVGIGTTTPYELLDVSGSGVNMVVASYDSQIFQSNPSLKLRKSNNNTVGTVTETADNTELGAVTFDGVNSNSAFASGAYILGRQMSSAGGTYVGGEITFYCGTNSAAPTQKMTIQDDGNVGIGTDSPGRKLTVAGSNNLVFLDSSGNSYLTIDRGATDRSSALVFSTNGDGTSSIPNNTDWALGSADSDEVGDGTGFFIGTSTNATYSKLFIEQDGNVGIGTSSPSSTLDVVGTVTASGGFNGEASSATKLQTPRTIGIAGDITATAVSFDGTGNISISAEVDDDSHNHIISNIDGLQTALNDSISSTATSDQTLSSNLILDTGKSLRFNSVKSNGDTGTYTVLGINSTSSNNHGTSTNLRAANGTLNLFSGESFGQHTFSETTEHINLVSDKNIMAYANLDAGWASHKAATLLDTAGNSSFPGTVSAGSFSTTGTATLTTIATANTLHCSAASKELTGFRAISLRGYDTGTYTHNAMRVIGRNNTWMFFDGGVVAGQYDNNGLGSHGKSNYLGTPVSGEIRAQSAVQSDGSLIQQRALPVSSLVFSRFSSNKADGWMEFDGVSTGVIADVRIPVSGLYRLNATVEGVSNWGIEQAQFFYFVLTFKVDSTDMCMKRWEGVGVSYSRLTSSIMGLRYLTAGDRQLNVECTAWSNMASAKLVDISLEFMGTTPTTNTWNANTTALEEASPAASW